MGAGVGVDGAAEEEDEDDETFENVAVFIEEKTSVSDGG